MDIAYDTTWYNFTEETWLTIFAYESKLKSHKRFKKVNFKEREMKSFVIWVKNIINSPDYDLILAKRNLIYNSSNCHGNNDLMEEKRIHYKLEKIFNKNKYWLTKERKIGIRFSFPDVCETLELLKHSVKYNCLEDFLTIPDVWYIVRNIRDNWSEIEIYLVQENNTKK